MANWKPANEKNRLGNPMHIEYVFVLNHGYKIFLAIAFPF